MAKVERIEVSLDNGTQASFQKEDVEGNKISEQKVVANEWKAGTGIHFGCGLAFMDAVAQQIPDFVMGKYEEVPVIDGKALAQDIINSYIEVKGLNVVKGVAASRTGATKKLAALKEAIGDNQAIIEALKLKGITL